MGIGQVALIVSSISAVFATFFSARSAYVARKAAKGQLGANQKLSTNLLYII